MLTPACYPLVVASRCSEGEGHNPWYSLSGVVWSLVPDCCSTLAFQVLNVTRSLSPQGLSIAVPVTWDCASSPVSLLGPLISGLSSVSLLGLVLVLIPCCFV